MACGQFGPIGLLRDIMSVYRKHANGAWAGQPVLEAQKKLFQYIDHYNEYFEYKYQAQFKKKQVQLEENILRLQTEPDSKPPDVKHLMEWNKSLLIQLAATDKMVKSPPTQFDERGEADQVGWIRRFLRSLRRFWRT
jgi:hypothetical protein